MNNDFDFVTLPRLCAAHALSLDRARERLRRDPELRGLGRVFGAARVFTAGEAAKIVQALKARKERRATRAVATA